MTKLRALIFATFLVCLVSCDPPQAGIEAENDRNPYFRKAAGLLENGLHHAAIKEYEKALHKAGDKVAWANVEIGLIYSEKLGDQISAIYFFQRYLEARPEAPEVDRVKNYVEKAKIDLVLGLPRPPSDQEELVLLREENKRLRKELQNRGWKPKVQASSKKKQKVASQPISSPEVDTSETAKPARLSVSEAQEPEVVSKPAADTPSQTYVIKPGDSLWKIATKFYPDDIPAGVEKIKKANTSATSNVRNLKVGKELIIP